MLDLPDLPSVRDESEELPVDAVVATKTIEMAEVPVEREDQTEQASVSAIKTAEVAEVAQVDEASVETVGDQTEKASGVSISIDSIQIVNSFDPFQSFASPFARKKRFFST